MLRDRVRNLRLSGFVALTLLLIGGIPMPAGSQHFPPGPPPSHHHGPPPATVPPPRVGPPVLSPPQTAPGPRSAVPLDLGTPSPSSSRTRSTIETPQPPPSHTIIGSGAEDDRSRSGSREVRQTTRPPRHIPTVSDRQTTTRGTGVASDDLFQSYGGRKVESGPPAKVPTIPGTKRQPSWTVVTPQEKKPPAPVVQKVAPPSQSAEEQKITARLNSLEAEREFFLSGHGRSSPHREMELSRLNTEIAGLQALLAKIKAAGQGTTATSGKPGKAPTVAAAPPTAAADKNQHTTSATTAAAAGATLAAGGQPPAAAASPTAASQPQPDLPATAAISSAEQWRTTASAAYHKLTREILALLDNKGFVPIDGDIDSNKKLEMLTSEYSYLKGVITKKNKDIEYLQGLVAKQKEYLAFLSKELADYREWSQRVNSGGRQNWVPWTKGEGFKTPYGTWIPYSEYRIEQEIKGIEDTIKKYEADQAQLKTLLAGLEPKVGAFGELVSKAPTTFTADGRPLWGQGTKEDPYREYPGAANGPVIGAGTKDDPLRLDPKAGVQTAQADADKKIWGTGSKEDPFRDYPDVNNPPQRIIGRGTKDDPYRAAPPPSPTEKVVVLGATFDGKTYKDGQKIVADNGVEYVAKGGQWLPVRNLTVGEIYLDNKGDLRLWTGGNGILLDDWQKQEKVNAVYAALKETDWQRNINREGATDKALDKTVADRKQADKLLADLRDLQKHVFDRQEFAEAWTSGEAGRLSRLIDTLAAQVNETGSVDQARLEQFKRVYTGLLSGNLVTKSQQEATLQAGGYLDVVRAFTYNSVRELLTGEYTTADGETKTSYAGLSGRLVAALLTGGHSETVFLTGKGYFGLEDYVYKQGGNSALEGFQRVGEKVATEGLFIWGMEAATPYLLQGGARTLEYGLNTAVRAGEAVAPQLTNRLVLTGMQFGDDAARWGTEIIEQLNREVQFQLPEAMRPLFEKATSGAGKSYGQYLLEAQKRATNIIQAVKSGKPLTAEQVMEAQADPATMRYLKQYIAGGTKTGKQVGTEVNKLLSQITDQADAAVQKALESRYPGEKIKVETVRTPKKEGYQAWDLNTDRDIRVLRQRADGVQVEIPKQEWEQIYNQQFAEASGVLKGGKFDLAAARQRFPEVQWEGLSETQKISKWAELHNQEPSSVFERAGARDFSDQATAIRPGQPGPEQRTFTQAAEGQGTLLDPEQLALMTNDKVRTYWSKGAHAASPAEALKYQTEALEQLAKQADMAQKLTAGYGKQFQVKGLDAKLQKGIEIIKNRALAPAVREQLLIQAGFSGGVTEFSEKLAANIHSLRIALPR